MDKFTREKRSEIMSAIRSKNTAPELKLFELLDKIGLTVQRHSEWLPGKPDAAALQLNLAIFMHGCFWHSHAVCRKGGPKTRQEFWGPKLARNAERDAQHVASLRAKGWRVLVIWECQLTKKKMPSLEKELRAYLGKLGWADPSYGEGPAGGIGDSIKNENT
jgi:DNA mismatch endonuclease (patch repair protein)